MSKKLTIGLCALAVGVISALLLVIFRPYNSMQSSLNAKKYETVQVKTVMKTTYIGAAETGREGSSDMQINDVEVVMQRDGGIIYESGISGQYYFYERDNTPYVLYYDLSLSTDGTGKWVEVPRNRYNLRPAFDFSVLNTLTKKDFTKENGAYVPVPERLEDMFFTLFGISSAGKDNYEIYDMKITLTNNRMDTITANYVFSGTSVIEQTLSFSYDDIKLSLPAVDEVYTDNKE